MRQPEIYNVDSFLNYQNKTLKSINEISYWGFARPMGHNLYSMFWRFKLAFYVLIGKYDALDWNQRD